MTINTTDRKKLENYVKTNQQQVRLLFKVGEDKSESDQRGNYKGLQHLFDLCEIKYQKIDVDDAVEIVGKAMGGRTIEALPPGASKPKVDPAAAAKKVVAHLMNDSSGVEIDTKDIFVALDCDQLKHQHKSQPIGSRQTGGGTKFGPSASAAWHKGHTMVYMGKWAKGLSLEEGDKPFHGQSKVVDGVHYEGYCQMLNGKKYVLFHCYPDTDGYPD